MPKIAKWTIVGVLALVLGVCVYFCAVPKTADVELTITKAEEGLGYSTEKELCDDFYVFNAEGDAWVRNETQPAVSFYTGSSLIFDVVLTNFSDVKAFLNANYSEWLAKFEGITNYFRGESQGKLTIDFNVHVADIDTSYYDYDTSDSSNDFEQTLEGFALFDKARAAVHTTLKTAGTPDCRFLVVSIPEDGNIDWSTLFWPHATVFGYIQSFNTRMILCNSQYCVQSVLCHEIYHILGLPDLYSADERYVGEADMMGTNTEHGATSAYFKQKLGWYNEGDYDDGVKNNIENISAAGTYTLDMVTSNGTNAYKFGINGNEYFLIEPRVWGSQKFLAINRINTNYWTNMNAKDESETVIYSFPGHTYGNGIYVRLFTDGDSIGLHKSVKKLYYSSDVYMQANYCIKDIDTSVAGKISFFFTPFTGNGYFVDNDDDVPAWAIADVKVFISVKDGEGANIIPTNIYAYNTARKEWLPLTVSRVYVGNKQYFTFERSAEQSKIKVTYGEYLVMQQKEFALADDVAVYDVQFDKTVFSHIGDFVKSAQSALADFASSIYNFFAK